MLTGAVTVILAGAGMFLVALASSGEVTGLHLPVFLAASLSMMLCIAAAGHLHRALILPLLPALPTLRMLPMLPLPDGSPAGVATLIPLVFLAAGAGFTSSLLAAKVAGVIPLRDIPVEDIFHAGGAAGLLMEAGRRGAGRFRTPGGTDPAAQARRPGQGDPPRPA